VSDGAEPPGEHADWLHRVRALGPAIDASAAAREFASEIATGIVELLDAAGVYALMAPRDVGGGEAHPLDLIDVISELSYWDGSTGWYAHAVMTGGSVAGALFGDSAVEAIFPGGRYAHVAGQVAPTGTAVREGDGFRIKGRFSFGSGTPHAQWIVGGYVLDDLAPVMLIAVVPRSAVRFLDNWDVIGLRGTGSHDFEVPEQWIHGDFVHDPMAPRAPRGGALQRMGPMAMPCLSHGAFALGAARRMLDEWRAFACGKARPGGQMASESAAFQRDFSVLSADLRAADAYFRRTFTQLFDAARTGTIADDLRLDGRLCANHALAVALRIAQAAFTGCTTAPLRNGSPIQRCFRDIQAGNAHFLTAEQSVIDAGKVLAGVEGAVLVF
jgi:alkylation response protein AidB-like acyl-CoA dehydrogenase